MYEDLEEDLLACDPCQVRWAQAYGTNCWVCSHPGQSWALIPGNAEERATVVAHRLRRFLNT